MRRIFYSEVVTRDGFQNEPTFVPTEARQALIDELGACGYAKIEVTSFTSPRAIPMLRDADELMARALPEIVGHDVPGQLAKAGLVTDLHEVPSHVSELR